MGNVATDDDITDVLATADMPPQAVARRLAAMRRGEWLVRPEAMFVEETPRPFLATSLPPPTGHPDSDALLADDEATRLKFDVALTRANAHTRRHYAQTHQQPGTTRNAGPGSDAGADGDSGATAQAHTADAVATDDGDSRGDDGVDEAVLVSRRGSLLPYTHPHPRVPRVRRDTACASL